MRFREPAAVVVLFALAIAYVEAALVVDLTIALGRQVGVIFPLVPPEGAGALLVIEVGRELATMVMLAAVGVLAGRTWVERLAWTAVAFGMWDIGYYGWLWVFTGWPPALDTWDLLFLVPVPWTGPVWAPLAVSVALVGFGLAAARRVREGGVVRLSPWHAAAGVGGGLLVIVSFTIDAPRMAAGGLPEAFAWPIFLAGLGLAGIAAVDGLRSAPARATSRVEAEDRGS